MGKRKIPLEEEPAVVKMYLDGSTIYQIADKYGVTGAAVGYLLRRNNVNRRDRRLTTQEQEDAICWLYESGIGVVELGEQYTIDKTTVYKILRRNNAKIRSLASYRTYPVDNNAFDDLSTEDAAYWLGFLYADGCVMPRKYCVSVAISIHDIDHLEKLRWFMKAGVPLKLYRLKSTRSDNIYGYCRLVVYSMELMGKLDRLGIVKKRGKFDRTLLHLPEKSYRHFIRGFFDGDGTVDVRIPKMKPGKVLRVRFLGQGDILSWLSETLTNTLGVNPRKLYQRTGIMGADYDGSLQATKIMEWMYKDSSVFLERKKKIYDDYIEYKSE